MSNLKQKTIWGFIWRFLQNVSSQLIGFVISIVLARILMPSDYGMIAMITVFTSLANVFITTGFSSSVVQKQDITEKDLSTIFYASIVTGAILYMVLFLESNNIASFYHEPRLEALLKVQSLTLIVSSLYSTHSAILTREMLFKKSFIASLCGVSIQGVVGIALAYAGYGPWALVLSHLVNSIVNASITWFIVKWIPSLSFSWNSFRGMFAFSSKILCISLNNTLFQNIQSLIIGRHYTSSDLAFYNRGQQFPTLVMQQIDGSMTTVMFSSLSKYQNDWNNGLRVLRLSMRTSMFVCFPLMIGMFAAAEPLVRFLLTDKWIESIPYLRIMTVICIFWPLSARSNALNALGKSGVSLLLNIGSQIITLLFVVLTYKISVILMVSSTIFTSVIFQIISAFVYRRYLNYKILEQISDILPSMFISIVMGCTIYLYTFLDINQGTILLLQAITGITIYITLSHIFKCESYVYIMGLIKKQVQNLRHK